MYPTLKARFVKSWLFEITRLGLFDSGVGGGGLSKLVVAAK
jgi:hypothetical protein